MFFEREPAVETPTHQQQTSLAITYTVTGGSSLYNIYTRLGGAGVTKTAWIGVFSAVELLLAQIPSFHHLTFVSLMGAVCSLGYSAIAATLSGVHAASNGTAGVSYAPGGKDPPTTPAGTLFGVSSALSTVAFAYGACFCVFLCVVCVSVCVCVCVCARLAVFWRVGQLRRPHVNTPLPPSPTHSLPPQPTHKQNTINNNQTIKTTKTTK